MQPDLKPDEIPDTVKFTAKMAAIPLAGFLAAVVLLALVRCCA